MSLRDDFIDHLWGKGASRRIPEATDRYDGHSPAVPHGSRSGAARPPVLEQDTRPTQVPDHNRRTGW
jgi:hypothetical protein